MPKESVGDSIDTINLKKSGGVLVAADKSTQFHVRANYHYGVGDLRKLYEVSMNVNGEVVRHSKEQVDFRNAVRNAVKDIVSNFDIDESLLLDWRKKKSELDERVQTSAITSLIWTPSMKKGGKVFIQEKIVAGLLLITRRV